MIFLDQLTLKIGRMNIMDEFFWIIIPPLFINIIYMIKLDKRDGWLDDTIGYLLGSFVIGLNIIMMFILMKKWYLEPSKKEKYYATR